MSDTDTGDVLYGTDVANVVSVRQKILLTGTCWYELTGLWFLLSALGYDVYRVPLEEACKPDGWELIIVALSAEPVAGWGKHLTRIRKLRAEMSGKMLVLVPKRLEMLRVLRRICPIYSGVGHWSSLVAAIRVTLKRMTVCNEAFRLTKGQRLALTFFSTRGRRWPKLYWHYARLAENVGVRDFRMLILAGLDKEIDKMDGR